MSVGSVRAPRQPFATAPALAGEFDAPRGYFNSASRHPISRRAAAAVARYGQGLATLDPAILELGAVRERVIELFARLIGADADEIACTPSTVFAENLIVQALSLPCDSRQVITDSLHFFGSLALYEGLRRQGQPVTVLQPDQGRIDLEAMRAALRRPTRLVALSLVSAANGFEHDLAAVCEMAHAAGALVYADIIQAAGASPLDVRASGVDFCACATYKWLMGDMGLGFLYVRRDRWPTLRRPAFGQDQLVSDEAFLTGPWPAAPTPMDLRTDATGLFQVGTLGNSALVALDQSLPLLLNHGVARIEAERQPHLARIREAFAQAGFTATTPPGSRSAIVAFDAGADAVDLRARLDQAGVRVTWRGEVVRISPSLFTTDDDVALLVEAVGTRS